MSTDTTGDQVMVSTRILTSERDLLDAFVTASGLSRVQVIRSMIHLLPTVAEQIAETAETLPERPSDVAKRERTRAALAAWAEKSSDRKS